MEKDDIPPGKRRKVVVAKLRALNEQFAGYSFSAYLKAPVQNFPVQYSVH
jgi:hypothetical protein